MTARDPLHLSRREFLAAANAAAFLLLLQSCSGPFGLGAASASPASGTLLKEALTTLLAALRASPDHLAFRAADAAATKNAAKIVSFVRDSLAVVPAWGSNEDVSATRWGSAATQRSGQGTLRERADILADLLTRAGFKASVMAADRPPGIGITQMYKQRPARFAPSTARVDAARSLLRQAGLPAAEAQHAFDSGPDPVAAIIGALPSDLQVGRVRTDLLPQTVPVVEFMDGANKRYAFALGDLGITDTPPSGLRSAGDPSDTPAVTITVSALSQPAPGSTTVGGRLIDVVSGTWRADKIVGRQVILTFTPPQGPKAILDTGLSSLPVRIPTLRVQTEAPATSTDQTLLAAGSLITVHGDVLGSAIAPAPATGSPIPGPYGSFLSLSDADRAAAQGHAASIKVSANATAFPEVELVMDVSDSSGASVDGLDARSFTLKEQGAAIGAFSVYSNSRQQQRPRVLVIYDSYVDWWPNAAAKSKFDSALATALVAQAAKTPFDVQVVGIAANPSAGAWAPPDAAQLTKAFGAQFESADDPWAAVGGMALDQGVNAFIVISDFNNLDTDVNKVATYQHRVIGARVPVYAVPSGQANGGFNAAVAAELVSLSGGASFNQKDASTPGKIATAVGGAVGSWISSAYRLRYRATAGDPKQRTVTVGITGRDQPAGNATYQVPDKPIPPPSFAGLYVRIEMAGLQSIRRLTGVELNYRGATLGPIGEAAAIAETRAALDGVTTIAIEPGSPTSAAILDDVVSSLLTIEPLAELPGSATSDQLLKAGKNGVRRIPLTLASLLRPTHVDPAALAGLKVLILQDRALAADQLEEHADLAIGANPVIPITTDPAAAFKAAVATSVAACAAEAATFSNSAYALLSGVPLTLIKANDNIARDAWLARLLPSQPATWRWAVYAYDDYHRLVPAGGQANAFWVVDPATGVAKAALLDSTGGAILLSACHYDAFDQLAMSVAFLAVLCSLGGAELFPLWCVGINVLAVGLAVAAYFGTEKHNDIGTPFSIALPFAGLGGAGLGGLEASIGIMLMLITIQKACSGGGA